MIVPVWPELLFFIFVLFLLFASVLGAKCFFHDKKIDVSQVVMIFAFVCALIFLLASFIAPNFFTVCQSSRPLPTDVATIINGLMSPFIAIAAAILTFMAFWVQYNANQNIQRQNEKQQAERQFYQMLKIHRDNVDKMEFPYLSQVEQCLYGNFSGHNPGAPLHWKKEENPNCYKGQTAIKLFLKEFKCIYEVVDQLKYSPSRKFAIAYNVFFFGLESYNQKFRNYQEVLDLRKKKNAVNKKAVGDLPKCSIMNGHKDVLNPYYRHLYLTVKSVVKSDFTDPEKENYLNILRASLTAEEQTLLVFNWYYGKLVGAGYGLKWEFENQKFFTHWKMIHNVVKKDFSYIKGMENFGKLGHLLDKSIQETDEARLKELFEEYLR